MFVIIPDNVHHGELGHHVKADDHFYLDLWTCPLPNGMDDSMITYQLSLYYQLYLPYNGKYRVSTKNYTVYFWQ